MSACCWVSIIAIATATRTGFQIKQANVSAPIIVANVLATAVAACQLSISLSSLLRSGGNNLKFLFSGERKSSANSSPQTGPLVFIICFSRPKFRFATPRLQIALTSAEFIILLVRQAKVNRDTVLHFVCSLGTLGFLQSTCSPVP